MIELFLFVVGVLCVAILVRIYYVEQHLIFNNHKLQNIMGKIQELEAQLGELSSAIADERAQVLAAIESLETKVEELSAQVAEGGTPEQLQALIDNVKEQIVTVKAIIPDADGDEELPEPGDEEA